MCNTILRCEKALNDLDEAQESMHWPPSRLQTDSKQYFNVARASQEKYQESRRHHDLHVLVGSFEVRIPIAGMRLRAARPCTPEALELYRR